MRIELLDHYISLVEFLGVILGPSYEVALYDLTAEGESIVAITNGHVTGRSLGAPLSGPLLGFLSKDRYKAASFEANYTALNINRKLLRSSVLYIKDNGRLVGLLNITFDDERYKDVSKLVMSLCHPDELLQENSFERVDNLATTPETEVYGRDIHEVFNNTIRSVFKDEIFPVERMKKDEKLQVVASLHEKGIFLLKGAVTEVAALLDSSEATIYRYINEVEHMEDKD